MNLRQWIKKLKEPQDVRDTRFDRWMDTLNNKQNWIYSMVFSLSFNLLMIIILLIDQEKDNWTNTFIVFGFAAIILTFIFKYYMFTTHVLLKCPLCTRKLDRGWMEKHIQYHAFKDKKLIKVIIQIPPDDVKNISYFNQEDIIRAGGAQVLKQMEKEGHIFTLDKAQTWEKQAIEQRLINIARRFIQDRAEENDYQKNYHDHDEEGRCETSLWCESYCHEDGKNYGICIKINELCPYCNISDCPDNSDVRGD